MRKEKLTPDEYAAKLKKQREKSAAKKQESEMFNPDLYSDWLTGGRASSWRESHSAQGRSPYKFNF